MWVVLILALFGRLSEGILIPQVEPIAHVIPRTHQTIPILQSPIIPRHGGIVPGIGRGLHSIGSGGIISDIFNGLLGGGHLRHDDHHLEESLDGTIHGDSQGLSHGHVGDNCQHRQHGCDVPGYHCVQTSESSYSLCNDGQSAHCHCKRGCIHKGFFLQSDESRMFNRNCCVCRLGRLRCRRLRRRRCWRSRRYDNFSRRGSWYHQCCLQDQLIK